MTTEINLTPSQDYALRALVDPTSLPDVAPRIVRASYERLMREGLIVDGAAAANGRYGTRLSFYPQPTDAGRAHILGGAR